jgi:succinoglycan biosynthesis transport protein ExoP
MQASAINENLKQRFRREISMVGRSKNESEFWAQYRDQMTNLERAIKTGVGEIAKNATEDWLSLVQGALSARVGLLQGQIANRQVLYDTLTQRITEIDVSEENNEGEIKIAEPAYSSGHAVTNKLVRLGQGVFGGIMLGCGLAYLLGRIDYKIYDVRTLEEATALSCLAAIPSNKVFDLQHEWKNVFESEPNSVNAEAVRNLRASILLLGKAERHKTILITSSIPGEGKTTTASELAAAFALNDQKTILVDFDLRKPRIHTLFPYLDKSIGMSGVLAGHIELPKAVQETKIDGLHVICAGTKAPNPSELLHEEEIDAIISKLSEYYDRIVIDTPPILPVSDTRILVKHVHSVILVVRALKAPVGAILRTKELLVQAKAPMAGVVLNDMKRKRGGGGYSYYGYKGYGEYGGSGGYGGYYEEEEKS